MARYSIEDTTLTALGDAVRSVVGETRKEPVPITDSYDYTIAPGATYSNKQFKINNAAVKIKFKFIGEDSTQIQFWHLNSTMSRVYIEFDTNNEAIIDNTDYFKLNGLYLYIKNNGSETCNFTIEATGIDSEGNVITELGEVPNTLTPLQMAEEINNLPPVPPEEALEIVGDCNYKFSNGGWDWFINLYGNKVTTRNVGSLANCFYYSNVKEIPFELNMNPSYYANLSYAFVGCSELEAAPKINNLKVGKMDNLFSGCKNLKSFPEGFAEDWNWSVTNSDTSAYNYACNKMFYECYKIRSIPAGLLGQNKYNPVIYNSYSFYYQGFGYCYSLEELTNVPVHNKATWTSSAMNEFVTYCSRLKKLTFATQEDGTPYVVSWKSQVLDLTKTGFCANATTFKNNTGFTDDTKISSLEDWQNYRNGTNPDAWSYNVNYAVFGITAATELINSLPDTSAYLATAGGTNTLRFNELAAMEVPGERLGELSEEVIAAAAAKGWTVSF